MGHVIVLLSHLFARVRGARLPDFFRRGTDPARWGSLGAALLTLFQILTLEGWVEIQNAAPALTVGVGYYFSSFVLVGVFVVVNLFIAVVLNNCWNR